MNIEPTFLRKPYPEWENTESFREFCSKVNGLTPLNDAGERAVKMSGDFLGRLAQDDEQRQALLQGIEEHRRRVPAGRKCFYQQT